MASFWLVTVIWALVLGFVVGLSWERWNGKTGRKKEKERSK